MWNRKILHIFLLLVFRTCSASTKSNQLYHRISFSCPQKTHQRRIRFQDVLGIGLQQVVDHVSQKSITNQCLRLVLSKTNDRLQLANQAYNGKTKIFTGTALVARASILMLPKTDLEAARRAFYFWRRAGPMVAHYRFTQWWLDSTNASLEKRDNVYDKLHDRYCKPSLEIILHLKGLYVKIGQVMSSRPDFIPRQYVDLFCTVQDGVPPWPLERIERIVKDSLTRQGLEFHDVFESVGEVLGSAAIGQVHKAVLKDPWEKCGNYKGGKIVAIKVMHPDAKQRFKQDFSVFKWLCQIALPGWKPLLVELEKSMMTEFDYQDEAASLVEVGRNMKESPYAKRVCVPEPVIRLCSKNLLVMEMLEGKKLVDSVEDNLAVVLGGDKEMARTFLEKKRRELFLGKETDENESGDSSLKIWSLVRKPKASLHLLSLYKRVRGQISLLLDVHGHQLLINGVFNGDPHAGNILEMPDGRLGLIDYGLTKRLTDNERLALARVVKSLGKEPVNSSDVASAMRQLGFTTKFDNDEILTKYAALFFDSDLEGQKLGFATPQLYLLHLKSLDPMVNVPDPAVIVARSSFLFRGMGSMLEAQLHTAKRWTSHAQDALDEAFTSN